MAPTRGTNALNVTLNIQERTRQYHELYKMSFYPNKIIKEFFQFLY